MAKTRVMHVVNSLDSGLGRNVVNLISNMDSKKFEQEVCCIQQKGRLAGELKGKAKVIVLGKGSGKGVSFPLRLARLFARERVQIVHSHARDPLHQATPAALIARVPVIVYSDHNSLAERSRKRVIFFNRLMAGFCDCIVVVAKSLKPELASAWKISPKKIVVVRNGADFSFVREKTKGFSAGKKRRQLGLAKCQKIVFAAGAFRPEKNFAVLLGAMKIVLEKHPNAVLLFAGKGELEKQLKQGAKRIGLGKSVRFLGLRKDVLEIMKLADVFVVPSSKEALPQVLMEAMALGKPIVASNIAGIREAIESGKEGLLVDGNATAFAKAIARLLSKKGLAKKLGCRAKQKAEKEFRIENTAKKQELLYAGLLKKKGIMV